MHILPGYYKFIWHITIRIIFPPKFSEWTTLQIYEVRGQELHCSASVTHQSCLTAIQRAGFTKIWAQDVFFLPVCWEFGKSSLLNKYVLAAKEAESNMWAFRGVSYWYLVTSPSNHLDTNHCFECWWMWNFSASFLISQMPKSTFSKPIHVSLAYYLHYQEQNTFDARIVNNDQKTCIWVDFKFE